MTSTVKRVHLSLSKEDLAELKLLCEHFGESQSMVIRRALILLHYITLKGIEK